jgi:hypothetical protein
MTVVKMKKMMRTMNPKIQNKHTTPSKYGATISFKKVNDTELEDGNQTLKKYNALVDREETRNGWKYILLTDVSKQKRLDKALLDFEKEADRREVNIKSIKRLLK